MTKTIYLPLDERPCNWLFPQQLASMTDIQMVAPQLDILGQKKQRAKLDEVSNWLVKECGQADVLIVSIDMLVHGGIVPSRLHQDSKADCLKRLNLLSELKQNNPKLAIYAFNLITRVPAYSSSEEEPDYYDQYGKHIYELGWLTDKQLQEELDADEAGRLAEINRIIPSDVLLDYTNRREVNSYINEMTIDFVKQGIIDELIIPLDDNSEYGFSAMEQRKLTIKVERENLYDSISIYPGADEIGCTLFARVFCKVKQFDPALYIRYSSTKGPLCIPKYEDRSLQESIKAHLTSAGAIMADSSHEAHAILMVHSPAVGQAAMAETSDPLEKRHRSYFSEINRKEFVRAMEYYRSSGKIVSLADVALCNGADHSLMSLLSKSGTLAQLSSYAAWNTSGNSLGTVISHTIIRAYYEAMNSLTPQIQAVSDLFYWYRLIEDWGYQALVRRDVSEHHLPALEASYFKVSHVQQEVCDIITEKLNEFIHQYLSSQCSKSLLLKNIKLPWNRMFELELDLLMEDK